MRNANATTLSACLGVTLALSFLSALEAASRAGEAVQASHEPSAGTAIVHPVDGAIMVYVPSGKFIMGIDQAEAEQIAKDLGFEHVATLWAWEAYPKRTVYLPGYLIDKYEVTVEQWKRFIEATGTNTKFKEASRHFDKPGARLLPAGEILWAEAKQYAAWAGKALPTEAQWEKAARGTDGRLYPWGNEPPSPEHGHFGQKGHLGEDGKGPKLYAPVGSYPKGVSPYGAFDMLGNQYEWTSELLQPYPGNPEAEKMNDYIGKFVVLRGGSWYHGWVGFYAAKRFGLEPDETYYHVGFRTVWTPPAGYFESEDFEKAKAAVAARAAQIEQWRQEEN